MPILFIIAAMRFQFFKSIIDNSCEFEVSVFKGSKNLTLDQFISAIIPKIILLLSFNFKNLTLQDAS